MSDLRPSERPVLDSPRHPWARLRNELVLWFSMLIVRKDAHGRYIPPSEREDPRKVAFTVKAEPTADVLRAHFADGPVIGLFLLDQGGFCRGTVVDIDRHGEEGSQEVNEKAATALHDRVIAAGLSAFLEDSNGRGGYKLWLIFREPVPARWVRRYLRRLVSDWEDLGLVREPEIFPKQDELGPGKLGNFVRLPGRHHTLKHKSRIWDGSRWLTGEAAARKILATVGSTADVIPEEFRAEATGPSCPAAPKTARGAGPSTILMRSIRSALDAIPPDGYEQWLKLGLCLVDLGDEGLELWVEISQKCPRYRPGACREKWSTFKPGGGLTYKTIFHLARQKGWKPPKRREADRSPKSARSRAKLEPQGRLAPVKTEQAKPAPPKASGDSGDGKGAPPGRHQSDPPMPPAGDGPGTVHGGGRGSPPVIIWNNRQMHPVTEEALDALKSSNRNPRHFRLGNLLVRVRNGESGPSIEHHTENSLRGVLDRSARWVKTYGAREGEERHVPTGAGDGKAKHVPTPPPKHVVRDILSLPEWPEASFPPLARIVRCPTFANDGSLVDQPGYHRGSKNYFSPPAGFDVPAVPSHISEDVLAEAKRLLLEEYLGDFPFKTPSDRATALAALITPLARDLITGPTPFFLIEAPVMGTGKTKLAECLLIPALGHPSTSAQPENEDEWRKSITASLADSPGAIWYDNLAGSLKSQKLEQVLTSDIWTDRWLGETRTVSLPVRCMWIGTANNLQILGDLHRRIVWIRLVSLMERPEDRDPSQFRHRLPEWALEHRAELLWAALVLIRAWIIQGRPPGPQSMASYESWAKTIGGILKVAGVDGFLDAQKERRIDSDDSAIQWEAFLKTVYQGMGSQDFGVNDLKWVVDPGHPDYNDELLQGVLTKETKGERSKQLGWRLRQNEDRVFGRYQLLLAGRDSRSKCRRYKVVELDRVELTAATWSPDWDQAVRTNPLVVSQDDTDRSKAFWGQVASRGLRREYLEDYGGQLWEVCHNLWLACDGYRLVTDKALLRLAESAGIFPRFFPSDTEEGRTLDLFEHLDLVNFVLRGLMEINVYDHLHHDGRTVVRYSILQGDDLEQVDEQPEQEGKGRDPSPRAEPSAAPMCVDPRHYRTFADLFRRWWRFENHTLITLRVLQLVHEFNLLPGYADSYPEGPQERQLARLLLEAQGVEFDGFVIQHEGINNYSRTEQGEADYLFTLNRLRGFVPPPLTSDRLNPGERRQWVKEYQFTGADARWLLTPS